MGIAGAIVGAGVLGAGASIIGSSSAAHTEANAANNATATQLGMYQDTVGREQPFVDAGNNALKQLLTGLGLQPGGNGTGSLNAPFTAANLEQTPGYQFTKQQGQQAILDQASAVGGVGGNALKALTTFNSGLASTTYEQQLQDYLQQQQQKFGNLETIAGSGQNAAANLGALGTNVGTSVGNNIIGAGNASAAGTIASTNAITGTVNNLSSNFLLSQLLNGGGGGGGAGAYGIAGSDGIY